MLVVFSPPSLFSTSHVLSVSQSSLQTICAAQMKTFTALTSPGSRSGTWRRAQCCLRSPSRPLQVSDCIAVCLDWVCTLDRRRSKKNKSKKLQIQTKIILLLCRTLMNQWTKMYWSNFMLYSFCITVFKHLIKRFSVEFEASLSQSVYVWPFHLQQSDLLQKI